MRKYDVFIIIVSNTQFTYLCIGLEMLGAAIQQIGEELDERDYEGLTIGRASMNKREIRNEITKSADGVDRFFIPEDLYELADLIKED